MKETHVYEQTKKHEKVIVLHHHGILHFFKQIPNFSQTHPDWYHILLVLHHYYLGEGHNMFFTTAICQGWGKKSLDKFDSDKK